MAKKRTYRERAENIKRAVIKRRKKIREMAVAYLGGKCSHCGYDKCIGALDIHHLDPNEKEFSISVDGNTRSLERVKREIDKCVLVCANCHRETHRNKKMQLFDIMHCFQ